MKGSDKQILKDLIRLTNDRVNEAVDRTMQLLDDSMEATVVERAMQTLFERLIRVSCEAIEDELGKQPTPSAMVSLFLARMATKYAPGWLKEAEAIKKAAEQADKA